MSTYFKLTVKNISRESEDAFSGHCFESGAAGVSEVLGFQQGGDTYEVSVIEADPFAAEVFFETRPSHDAITELRARWPEFIFELHEEENKDWLAEWKKGYTAFQLAGPYWVVPSWEKKPAQAETPLWIDPGMAFGTGTHATTYLVSKLLVEHSLCPKRSVLDVGTGTGILAMIAAFAGANRVVGTDIDPEARRVARENMELNELQYRSAEPLVRALDKPLHPHFCGVEILENQIELISEKFDVVIANIIDGVLVKLRPDLLRCLAPQGCLVLSGILAEREARFVESFLGPSQNGSGLPNSNFSELEIVDRQQRDEWVGLLLRRRGKESFA